MDLCYIKVSFCLLTTLSNNSNLYHVIRYFKKDHRLTSPSTHDWTKTYSASFEDTSVEPSEITDINWALFIISFCACLRTSAIAPTKFALFLSVVYV
jgi:hypothetical protein